MRIACGSSSSIFFFAAASATGFPVGCASLKNCSANRFLTLRSGSSIRPPGRSAGLLVSGMILSIGRFPARHNRLPKSPIITFYKTQKWMGSPKTQQAGFSNQCLFANSDMRENCPIFPFTGPMDTNAYVEMLRDYLKSMAGSSPTERAWAL